MNQELIWDHFQNEGVASFDGAKPRLEFLLNTLHKGQRTLNIGVGSGYFEEIAKRKGVEVWSLDPSERAIANLRTWLGMGERAQVGYSQSMPFPDEQFDAVIMSEVIEHLDPSTRGASLEEVQRVLKPGGRLVGTVPARERLEDSAVVCPCCNHHFHRWGHQASFDVESMTALLRWNLTPQIVEERFFNEWKSAGWRARAAGLIKKVLSWRNIGTYGAARNIFFVAVKAA